MSLYLLHSAKGTEWANHKYYKKENGIYFYSEDQYRRFINKSSSVGSGSSQISSTLSKKTTNKTSRKLSSLSSSSSKGKSSNKRTASILSKPKKYSLPKSSKISTSKVKGSSDKSAKVSSKETVSKAKEVKQVPKLIETKASVRDTIMKWVNLKINDSLFFELTDDGKYKAEVIFSDGDKQEFLLDSDFKLISKTERKKKDEV